jgi:hypothetical protein
MRPLGRFAGREAGLVAAAAIAFATIFCWRILANLTYPGVVNDWDMSLTTLWVACRSVRHFHQLPLWNPYECGGIPLFGDPQSRILTPFFPLHLVVGPIVGLHLEVPLHLAIAWAGGYVLARVLGIGWMGAVCTACTFSASSWFFLRAAAGHAVFLPMAYTPWVVAFAWLSATEHRLRWALLAAASVTITLGEGSAYTATFQLVLVALVMAPLVILNGSLWPIVTLIVVGTFSAGFSAVKLLPALAFYQRYPRPIDSAYWTDVSTLMTALFSHSQDFARAGLPWSFHEYGAYIGLFIVPALFALTRPRRAAPWIFAGLMLFLLARGDRGPHAPWTLLHSLPGFRSERLPARMLMLFVLTIGVLAGLGIDVMVRSSRRYGGIAAAVLITVATVDSFLVSSPNLRYALQNPLEKIDADPVFREYKAQFYYNDMLKTVLANRGAVECYQYTAFPTNVIGYNQPDYKGEQYMRGPGSVRLIRWTPNALSYDVSTSALSTLVINQNFDSSWRVVSGRGTVVDYQNLLAVTLPAGAQVIELRYVDSRLMLGAAITMLTLFVALLLCRFERRRPVARVDYREGTEDSLTGRESGNGRRPTIASSR